MDLFVRGVQDTARVGWGGVNSDFAFSRPISFTDQGLDRSYRIRGSDLKGHVLVQSHIADKDLSTLSARRRAALTSAGLRCMGRVV